MRHRFWLGSALAVAAVCSLAAPARAWDGITPPPGSVNAGGIALGPLLGWLSGRAMWIDSAGHVLGLDQSSVYGAPVLTTGSPRCWQLDATKQVDATKQIDLGALVAPAPVVLDGGAWRLAARPGFDSVLALAFLRSNDPYPYKLGSILVYQATCGAPAKQIATVTVPPGVPAGNQVAAETLALAADGTVYFVLRELVRLDTKLATPKWEVLATLDDLRALLGLSATQNVAFRAVALTADDRLWIAVEMRAADNQTVTASGLVAWGKEGKLSVLHAPDANLTGFGQLLHSQAMGKMLLATPQVRVPPVGHFQALAFLDEAKPFAFSGRAPPWPSGAALAEDGYFGSFDGSVYARGQLVTWTTPSKWENATPIRAIAVLPQFADFDRDGVSALREAELGLSDLQYDTDGDGYNDGAELGLLATDPKDASSHPPGVQLADVSYGPSFLIAESKRLEPYYGESGSVPYLTLPDGEGVLQCGKVGPKNPGGFVEKSCTPATKASAVTPLACVDSKAKLHCLDWPKAVSTQAWLSPDRHYAFAWVDGLSHTKVGIDRVELATAQVERIYTGDLTQYDAILYPLSNTAVLVTRNFSVLERVSASGISGVEVPGSFGCPTDVTASSLSSCPTLPDAGFANMQVVGYHPGLQVWIVRLMRLFTFDKASGLKAMRPYNYLAISKDKVGFVADGMEIVDGLDIEFFEAIPGGGFLVTGSGSVPGLGANSGRIGTFLVPDLFAPGPVNQHPQAGISSRFGQWFSHGFFGTQFTTYKERILLGGCTPKDKCEMTTRDWVKDIIYALRAEWVPVAPALEKGETVFASQNQYDRGSGGYRQMDGSYGPNGGTKWLLGRVSRLGAVMPWLDAAAFAKLATDPAAISALLTTPLGAVTALAASPDGARLCLAEGNGRVWEIALDAGRPTQATLADQAPGLVGCAYDENGTLARLVASPPAVRVGNQVLAGVASSAADGLARVAGHWLVRGKAEVTGNAITAPEAYCLADTGKITPSGRAMVALAEVPGGIAFIDDKGDSWLGRDPCGAGGFPEEELALGGLWNWGIKLAESLLLAGPRALAMRPDGMFLVARNTPDQYNMKTLFGMWPTYRPHGGVAFAEHNKYRREVPRTLLMSTWAVSIGAMTTLPGGDAQADWGHFDPPLPDYVPPTDATDTTPTKKASAPKPPADNSGCASGPGRGSANGGATLAMLAILWLLVALGRARQRRMARGLVCLEPR